MECRTGCGACCIVISITSPIPGMPDGKPAGVRCIQLTDDHHCKLYGHPDRPKVCGNLQPERDMCGTRDEDAFRTLAEWERMTSPH
ncbi:zinc/iron-chelating domain-containing protein [Paenibacillus sp. J45TS6]|uniref:YkgJ family cysteine cluster protein n=1 Tax=unclassified Paenibacillus TaxID=185978 RepID=UPI001B0E8053|nr:YkgJ family cysteine cluster protein [Paenibacillus sp. J45TS6]GIP42727.1 zinc/iron-chelating domain-containing protein [Paenibacillus sp. J45TS6]